MDSQAKYACLARGEGGIYFRTPNKGGNYLEKIWVRGPDNGLMRRLLTTSSNQDHAAGILMVEEAGGVSSDLRGQPINFGLGRTLGENHGVVACFKDLHSRVLEASKQAREEEKD
jgi:3'(2'), 5'-bisphosphate nucleotidase